MGRGPTEEMRKSELGEDRRVGTLPRYGGLASKTYPVHASHTTLDDTSCDNQQGCAGSTAPYPVRERG